MNKICFIGGGLDGGGQERALTTMANYLAGKGYEIAIINLFRTQQFYEIDKRIKIIWPNIKRQKRHRLVYAALIIPYLRREIRRTKPDVILSYGDWFNSFVIFATRFIKCRLFVFDRMGPELKLGKLVGNARKLLYKYADGVAVQTNTAKDILYKRTKAKNIVVIPNAVTEINTDTNTRKKQIVTVGRLSKEKGHLLLIKAFSRLTQQDWTLHLVGDGPERENLINEAIKLNITTRVIFYGHLKDFKNILGESEIFVLPSFYEGFPNALLEAMTVPLACISSNCVAGPSDIIENKVNGILFETGNVDELVESLSGLIEKDELREKIKKEAYKIRQKYNIEKISLKYLEFISG